MSTKIYYAWRMPERRLNDFIDFVRPQIYDEAEKIVRNLMSYVEKSKIEELTTKGYSEETARFKTVIDLIEKVAKGSSRAPGIDISFALNVWIKRDKAYIIPVGEFKNIKVPSWAEDYSYWNNTDEPENITKTQWTMRERMWESINCGEGFSSHNARRLCHSVIDFGAIFGDIDSEMELKERILG